MADRCAEGKEVSLLFRFCEERAAISPAPQPVAGPHGTRILHTEIAQAE
jgi:hypothetical protein